MIRLFRLKQLSTKKKIGKSLNKIYIKVSWIKKIKDQKALRIICIKLKNKKSRQKKIKSINN